MRRMNVIMRNEDASSDDDHPPSMATIPGGGSRKHECNNCHAEFPNKTTAERHMLFCKTLADIRRGSSTSSMVANSSISLSTHANITEDALLPTPREMFILIQELAAKYNKVKDELDVMKQWAKMVGRRIPTSSSSATSAGGDAFAGLDFTSITRQKRQNMEIILNEEDAEHPQLAGLRPLFSQWLSSDDQTSIKLTESDLNIVFHEDLVAGITSAILRVLSEYTVESGKSHLIPFKLADIKQGAFYIYDTAFKVAADTAPASATDPPFPHHPSAKWRAMEPCEFQLLVRTFHKLLFKEFKKWQDRNWTAQQEAMKQRQKAATSYQHVMSSFQCSPAMASCDGLCPVPVPGIVMTGSDDEEPVTPPITGADTVLSEDFATLYNKYADKMMGGALSDETILSRVRAKLWKDMKAWRL